MDTFEDFVDRVAANYGNPNAVFAQPGEFLDSGMRVKVMPTDRISDTILDGIIVKQPRKRPCVRVRINGRIWFLPVHKHQILMKW